MQKASDDGNIWKLANRIKGNHRNVNSPIHGRDGVKYDAIGKATFVADCLEDQFRPNETDDQLRDHYRLVRRGVQHFRNTRLHSCVEPVSGNEVRQIIKHLKPNTAPGHGGVTNSMIKQLPCRFVNHLVAIDNSALKLQHFPGIWQKS